MIVNKYHPVKNRVKNYEGSLTYVEVKPTYAMITTCHPDFEVFSSAEAVVSSTFLAAVQEDKLSFFNRICSIAKVNIICNTKGDFTAQGSWKKIVELEEIMKNVLKDLNCRHLRNTQVSGSYYLGDPHSEESDYFEEKRQQKVFASPAAVERSDGEMCDKIARANYSVNNENVRSVLSCGNDSVGPYPKDSAEETSVTTSNGNEIYVNITLTTCNSEPVDSREPISELDEPAEKVKALENFKVVSDNASQSVDQFKSTQVSERDKRKVYEQQAPFKFFCNLCSFKTKRESHYKKHVQLHKQGATKLYICSQCGFRTIRMGHLRRHELQHAPEALSCACCPYTTDSAAFMQRHQRLKHSSDSKQTSRVEEYLQCSHCDYTTTQPHFLKRHLRVHKVGEDSEKNIPVLYQCEKCNYKTRRKEHLERHQRDVHSEVRPFLCDACGKAFKRADALRQHRMARHHHSSLTIAHGTANSTSSVPHPHCCPQCSKPCRSQAHLKDHMATHSDERSFLCEICGSSFKTRAVQRKHISTVHANPKAFPCSHCVRRFSTKYALLRHKKIHRLAKEGSPVAGMKGSIEPKISDSTREDGKPANARISDLIEAVAQSGPDSLPRQEIFSRRAQVVQEMHRSLSSSAAGNESESVSLRHNGQEINEPGSCAVVIGLDGEVQSVSSGNILTRTPAPSETTTALLYLTTDFTQYR